MGKTKKEVNGENIIYHFIQKNILTTDELTSFQKQLIEHFIIDLGIWVHPKLYSKTPILLPFVIRDTSCRKKIKETGKDEWGTANTEGFLRDDNSLIKGIFKSCQIISPEIKEYNNHYMGNGFVASHIWREINGTDKLASTFHLTNSFIPNLVWLPKQVSKLTDRESSYAQKLLQTISYKIYRRLNSDSFTEKIWEHLPNPNIDCRFDIDKLNFFGISDSWMEKRIRNLTKEIDAILTQLDGKHPDLKKVKCSAYLPSLLERIAPENIDRFRDLLIENKKRIIN